MKNYLKDLEKELKKLRISDLEIDEILRDHLEMLEEAKADGVTDEEINTKFGSPEQVANQIYKDNFESDFVSESNPVVGEGELEGFELYKAFPVVSEIKEFKVSLVSEDILYFPYEGDSIQVFAKKLKNQDDYEITFNDNNFVLKRTKTKKFKIGFNTNNSTKFGVKVPSNVVIEKFSYSTVSGDGELDKVSANKVIFKTTSGDVSISNVTSKEGLKLQTVSGDIKARTLQSKELEISLVSGDIDLQAVQINNDININTVSGDAELCDVKCDHLGFRTVSGDLEGEEVYPDSVSFQSISGDFQIVNQIHEKEINITKKKSISGKIDLN